MTGASAVDSRIWTSRPAVTDGYGYLYVIEFDNGVVKVGKTTDPTGRMSTHISQAAAYRATPAAVWFSEAHLGYSANESAALAYIAAKRLGRQVRREYFHDANFAQVVDIVERACRGEDLSGQMSLAGITEAVDMAATILPRIIEATHGGLTPAECVKVTRAMIGLAQQLVVLEHQVRELEHDFAADRAAACGEPAPERQKWASSPSLDLLPELGGALARAEMAASRTTAGRTAGHAGKALAA